MDNNVEDEKYIGELNEAAVREAKFSRIKASIVAAHFPQR